jgi:hypothetical protein
MKVKRSDFVRRQEVDTDPDLSYLGEYSNTPEANAIDRIERGDCGRNEFRYCNVTLSGEETGNPESVEQDYLRLESYNRGDWGMIGIWAEVVLLVPLRGSPGSSIRQKIKSGGLWGIESDSDDEYLDSVYAEQCDELASILDEMGIE